MSLIEQYNFDIDMMLANHPIFSKDERKELQKMSLVIKKIDETIKLLEEISN